MACRSLLVVKTRHFTWSSFRGARPPNGAIARVDGPTELVTTYRNYYIGPWARQNNLTGAWTDSVIVNGEDVLESTGGNVEMPHRTYDQTVLAVSNGNGQIVRQEEFMPYGRRIAGTAAGGFEQHFQGIRADDLVIAGGRAYDPQRGQWLSRDPLPLGDPTATVNDDRVASLFSFDNGDPCTFRDPTGRQPPADQAEQNRQLIEAVERMDTIGTFGSFGAAMVLTGTTPTEVLASVAPVNAVEAVANGDIEGAALDLGVYGAELWIGGKAIGKIAEVVVPEGATLVRELLGVGDGGSSNGAGDGGAGGGDGGGVGGDGNSASGGGGGGGRAGHNGVHGPAQETWRTTRGGDRAVSTKYPDGSVKDVSPARVKEFVPATDPRAPSGTMQKVKFDNPQPGSKGYKRDPTPDEKAYVQ